MPHFNNPNNLCSVHTDKTSDDYSMVGYGRTENYLYPVTSAGGDRSVHTYDYTTPPPGHPGNNDEGYEDMSGGAL